MRTLYTVFYLLMFPLVLVHLLLRGIRNPAYWRRWPERLGTVPLEVRGKHDVWLHSVSVGETQAAAPLVQLLLKKHPDWKILITTTTPTGSDRVRELFGDRVMHMYAPYDLPFMVGRFLQHTRPRLAVFMETELWPNISHQCARAGIPLVIANARLSERSAQSYKRFGRLVREMLGDIRMIAAQTTDDADRFRMLGMREEGITVTGSIKFEMNVSATVNEQAEVLRRIWGTSRGVLIAASTHEGEDEQVLDAAKAIWQQVPDMLLVIVPRHPERFQRVESLVKSRGYKTARRSDMPVDCDGVQVFVGDTMGEMPLFYAASDVAFVGGSLVGTGGHNMLEASALGLPVLTGPHVFNFARIAELLVGNNAATMVHSSTELADEAVKLLKDANLRQAMGEQGRKVVEDNRGALQRLYDLVVDIAG